MRIRQPFVTYLPGVPLAVILCTALGNAVGAQSPTDLLSAKPEAVEAWKDMRYGMFLCWGPVSLTGKEIGWSRGAPAWGRQPGVRGGKGPTPAAVYDDLYKEWKPDKFDAEHWVQVAKEGGMKYLIFLVKHHDGFCLYDTKLTDYKSTGPESAWQVDVMKHVADACRKHDLKLMIYYSQPDWHHLDYLGEHHERYIEYLHGQIRELLTNYGHIDGLWFDNLRGRGNNAEAAKLWDSENLFKMARSIQPHLIVNDRCGLDADFYTPENQVGFFMNDRAWETNATLNGQWAWEPREIDPFFRSFDECIQMLVSCAAGDGNFALNTGPMPDGRIEPRQVERFREIGRWLGKYGESIYGTRGGPFIAPDEKTRGHGGYYEHFALPTGRWWGGSTHKGNTVYLHLLRWPAKEIVLPNIRAAGPPAKCELPLDEERSAPVGRLSSSREQVLSVLSYCVLTGGEAVVTQDDEGIHVTVPADQQDPLDTIVKLQFDRSVVGVEPVRTGQPPLVAGGRATASGVWPDPRLGPELAFDDDPTTRWGGAPDSTDGWLAIELAEPKTFSRVRIREAYDRIQKFEIQIQQDSQWRAIHAGKNVGGNFSVTFDPVTAQHVRLDILEATNVPTIWEVQLLAE